MRFLQWRARNGFVGFHYMAVVLFLVLVPAAAVPQSPPLQFFNNFFVTGDYVVAGAQGLNKKISNGYTTGTITVPDKNPGIQGATQVPPGAQIVAAFLYWQTAEKASVQPGQPGSGQIAFFRPLGVNGGPQTGYQIAGVPLDLNATVSFSSGGCPGTSTGKLVRVYRADVRPYLAQDGSGNILGNGTYEVRLASTGNNTPLSLGASLVIIYRVLSPDVPLNSIVIYDGAYANTSAAPTMSQTIQGFYQAADPVSRITHIVGSGQSNKYQNVYLNNQLLPSLYKNQPPFPGYYGTWDNPTWTFSGKSNPISENDPSATTSVTPTPSNQGCVAWGAVIVSTTVKNTDKDGILDVWKSPPRSPNRPGYCDASVKEGVCSPGDPSWVDLPGAAQGQKDLFVQLDYMYSSGNYSFNPLLAIDKADNKNAVEKVVAAYASNSRNAIQLHVVPGNAIQEPVCTDNTSTKPPQLCTFPNQPGVVGWKGGLVHVKNQIINPGTGALCNAGDPSCLPVFQHGKKDSYHYALFAHAVGLPSWRLSGGTLTSVVQSGNTVTFTTSTPHKLVVNNNNANDAACPLYGRVGVNFAITNPKINGVFCVDSVSDITFTIKVPNSTSASYTFATDPNLAVAVGHAGSVSGFSDVGGADSLITLGNWGADGETWQTKAGTFMHELGHGNGLTHSGFYFDKLTNANSDYTPTIEANCKSNFQSVMNYLFQVDLLSDKNGNQNVDYSREDLNQLNEANTPAAGVLANAFYPLTSWYVPFAGVGTEASQYCDGRPKPDSAPKMVRVPGSTSTFSFAPRQDINFDGNNSEIMRGHSDWTGTSTAPGIDLRQIGATGSLSSSGIDGLGGGGGIDGLGGGGGIDALGGGGGIDGLGGGGGIDGLGGGGGIDGLGGGGGEGEINHDTANSVTRPPRNLTATEKDSPRTITLSWVQPTFGQIGTYNIYRSDDGGQTFTKKTSVPGNQLTYTDTVSCNPTGYQYYVTAVLANTTQESVQSNTVPGPNQPLLTGCYTNTPPTVALTGFTSPTAGASYIQGGAVPISWTLQDDDTGAVVGNVNANTLTAIGPIPHDGNCSSISQAPNGTAQTTLLLKGNVTPAAGASNFAFSSPLFTFNWDTTLFLAGCYLFRLDLDSGQPEITPSALELTIYVSDSGPYVTTTTLPDGVVGSAYVGTTLQEAGGNGAITWGLATGSNALPPGISLNPGTGAISGTPTAPGIYNFTAQATDSLGNFGTRALTLRVAIALYGDLVVVDGSPSANPLTGTVLRVTPTGTTGTIAPIANGSPTAVAADATTGNIYVAVNAVNSANPSRIVKIGPFGQTSDFVSGAMLASPVAVAVDIAGNVYVGDNNNDAIYKYNSSGTQVDAIGNPTGSAFATLSSSPNNLQDIRMAFDSAGNLIVATDNVGGTAGQAEVDTVDTTGNPTTLYNTTTNQDLVPAITSVGGIALLADGSIDVGDFAAKSIFKIANPGADNMAISRAVVPPNALAFCCNISGIANPPSNNGSLYVTLNGGRLLRAVPPGTVTTVLSGTPLTFPNDVGWYNYPPPAPPPPAP